MNCFSQAQRVVTEATTETRQLASTIPALQAHAITGPRRACSCFCCKSDSAAPSAHPGDARHGADRFSPLAAHLAHFILRSTLYDAARPPAPARWAPGACPRLWAAQSLTPTTAALRADVRALRGKVTRCVAAESGSVDVPLGTLLQSNTGAAGALGAGGLAKSGGSAAVATGAAGASIEMMEVLPTVTYCGVELTCCVRRDCHCEEKLQERQRVDADKRNKRSFSDSHNSSSASARTGGKSKTRAHDFDPDLDSDSDSECEILVAVGARRISKITVKHEPGTIAIATGTEHINSNISASCDNDGEIGRAHV